MLPDRVDGKIMRGLKPRIRKDYIRDFERLFPNGALANWATVEKLVCEGLDPLWLAVRLIPEDKRLGFLRHLAKEASFDLYGANAGIKLDPRQRRIIDAYLASEDNAVGMTAILFEVIVGRFRNTVMNDVLAMIKEIIDGDRP